MATFTLPAPARFELAVVSTALYSCYEARAVAAATLSPASSRAGTPVTASPPASPASGVRAPVAVVVVAATASSPKNASPNALVKTTPPPSATTRLPTPPQGGVLTPPVVQALRSQSPSGTPATPPSSPATPLALKTGDVALPPIVKLAADSPKHEGLSIPYEVTDLYNDIKLKKKHRFAVYKIVDMKVVVDKVAPRSASLQDFTSSLREAECCFAVYDHDGAKEDQYGKRVQSRIWFVLVRRRFCALLAAHPRTRSGRRLRLPLCRKCSTLRKCAR